MIDWQNKTLYIANILRLTSNSLYNIPLEDYESSL